jgi:hypothetical protein
VTGRFAPRRSWTVAGVYFAACWVAAASSGALDVITGRAVVTSDQSAGPGFWAMTVLVGATVVVGYWVVWPRGTHWGGRRPHRVSSIVFWVAYGLSEGLLYLSVWVVVADRLGRSAWTVVAVFGVVTTFNAVWRALVWDVWVTPEHNVAEWNFRKVLWVHAPVLVLAVTHVTLYEHGLLFVAFETVALLGATVHMRMPPPLPARSPAAA